jgi:hypothetical protein
MTGEEFVVLEDGFENVRVGEESWVRGVAFREGLLGMCLSGRSRRQRRHML